MNKYIQPKQEEFIKVMDFFKKEISGLRTGRANPGILDGVYVSAYGVKTPLSGLSSINVPDGQSITVAPWDKNVIKDIEKAIVDANLGIAIVNEGSQLRLTVPKMTEESRKEMVKKLNEKHEAARIAIRQIREDIKNTIEQAEKDKEITEDEKFLFVKELGEETAKQNENLKAVKDKKEQDIMTI
ncbi:ribosome recycling factor [Candidatus Parcubacteria bacterium]|nr:ribosome recycling factor [Candidatus Parcubacteria bacterium]